MSQSQPTTDKPKRMRKLLPLLSGVLVVAALVGALVFSINANNGAHAASAASAASTSLGSKIASIANGQIGGHCSNYSGCPYPGEWCAVFANWVWSHAGANTSGLTAAAGSYYIYGQNHHTLSSTPKVGDAVVFGYNGNGYAQHVALVVSVSGSNIVSVGGNERGGAGVVAKDGPYSSKLGYSSYMGMTISGYIAPLAGGKPAPVCPATIQNGSTGSAVGTLQSTLNSLRKAGKFTDKPYAYTNPLAVDKDFGPQTQAAVKDFQTAKKIGVDGIVGPQTWHALGKC